MSGRSDECTESFLLPGDVAIVVSPGPDGLDLSVAASGAPVGMLVEVVARSLSDARITAASVSTGGVLHIAAVRADRPRWRAVAWRRCELDFALARTISVPARERA